MVNQSNYENEPFIFQALDSLSKSIILHFFEEEEVLMESGYYDLEKHAEIHGSLVESMMRSIESYKNKEITTQVLFKFLYGQVIVGHMISEDIKYHNFIYTNTDKL
mgnify:CR=1 FL=1